VHSRGLRLVAVVSLAALALSACGGDGALSKDEFIEQADEICEDIDQQIAELGEPENREAFEELVDEGTEITNDGLERLRALEPPAEDRDQINRMLDKIEEAVELLPEIQVALEDRDVEALQTLQSEVQAAASEAQTIAEDYGFEQCARTDVAPGG
jgi:hypothetical protein